MGIFSRGGQSRRERKAMEAHLDELDEMRRERLSALGQATIDMAEQGGFDRSLLAAKAEEIGKIDGEADLIEQGLEEGLSLRELEDLASRKSASSEAEAEPHR